MAIVVVYERLKGFRRLGDSLGLGENALKLLERWGGKDFYHELTSIGNQAEDMQIRRWHDGKILAQQPLMDMAGYIGHRGDYHDAFLRAVRDAGIEIRMGCEVASYDENKPSITLADGTEVVADLIVGADGIKSKTRELVLGFHDAPKSSGYSCFRSYFPGDYLKGDERCKDFVSQDSVNIWIGPDIHLIQNTLRDGKEVNIIMTRKLSHEEDMEIKESWFQDGDINEVLALTTDIDPRIRAAVEKIPGPPYLLDWKICYRDPLPTWVSKSHKIALLGDSCHPHLPTSAQGASQATESAGALAVCLKLAGKDSIPLATRTYEKLRYPRTRLSQRNGEDLRDRWHNALKNLDEGAEIDPESVKMRNRWLYSFDAEGDAMQRWPEMSSRVSDELRAGVITPLSDEMV